MRPRDQARVDALEALYAELPTIECRGKCWDSCGRLPLLQIERRRIAEAGVTIPDGTKARGPMVCPALSMFRQCSVYEIRPTICRLWALVDNMHCNFGCVPTGGRLSVAEGYEFLARAFEIDGQHDVAARIRAPFATPELAAENTAIAMAVIEADAFEYDVLERRARANGSVRYVAGRGQLSKTPMRQHGGAR
jgi:Fe-S-cluster containining protein